MSRLAQAAEGFRDGVRHHGTFFRRVSADVLRIAGAVGLAQALVFAASPLLTRLYDPAAFGHFTILGAIVTILTPLASLRYGWALPLPKDEETAIDLLALCLVVTVAVPVLVGLVGALAVALPQHWVEIRLADALLLAAALLIVGLNEVVTSWLIRNQAFPQVAGQRFVTLLGTAVCQLAVAAVKPDADGLMLGFIGGYALGLVRAATQCRPDLERSVKAMTLHRLRRVAAEYRQFALLTAPSGVINGVGRQLPNVVLPSLYGLAMAGQWSLAHRVLWQPSALLGQAANQVLWGNAARLQTENPRRLWLLFLVFNAGLFALMTPGLILTAFGPEIFGFVFGAGWEEAGRYAGIIVLSSIVGVAAQATSCLHLYGLNRWMSAWEVGRLLTVAGAMLAVWWLGLSALGAVIAMTAAFALSDAALLALNTIAVWRIRRAEGRRLEKSRPEPASTIAPRSPG
ncbi:lipopolysaccharide biosynthesis protein [Azospirillum rugosum]|uniref:O-antigen/teichoic acid export membrane protein n=1 Tax=Azospirillum rugosum TaxID=416170 RepID=A0ABS4SFC7_9PROT|nr:lipopolysaccharide biosynthesis protein [Azospirillum rugosum]MBP2291283.1 O-antigen/teichoic acid export membrane protein [Azospirillum rugosum]MDQ0525071.1 O-antigen/teichoic acid export membrane protein [Azospirillum rugosum]